MPAMQEPRLNQGSVLSWILCLGALAVGARNFEQGGLGPDGPHYALIARGMAQTGEWLWMQGTVPKFQPSADYPHLGIWLLALVFKIFPAADWSARLVGIGFYLAFLGVFFRLLRLTLGVRPAVVGVLALWTMDRFSNYFSNVYLDPGLLFFGTSSLLLLYEATRRSSLAHAVFGGAAWALAFLYKGMPAAASPPRSSASPTGACDPPKSPQPSTHEFPPEHPGSDRG